MKHLAACLILIVGAGTPAFGQWTFDAAVGGAAPTSNSGFRTGLDLMGAVEQRLAAQVPFALRLELGWDRSVPRSPSTPSSTRRCESTRGVRIPMP